MKIKKLNKSEYEIKTKEDLIYITRFKNPNTINLGNNVYIRESLYIYFVDYFKHNSEWEEGYNQDLSEVFDETSILKEYLQNNFQIPTEITDQIKFERN